MNNDREVDGMQSFEHLARRVNSHDVIGRDFVEVKAPGRDPKLFRAGYARADVTGQPIVHAFVSQDAARAGDVEPQLIVDVHREPPLCARARFQSGQEQVGIQL